MDPNQKDISIVVPQAPEDIAPGTFIAIHEVIAEVPSFFWCGDATMLPPHEPVRIPCKPRDAGVPFKVKAACLPYVFAKSHGGAVRIFDLRRHRVVRLDETYARAVWDALRKRARERRQRQQRGHGPMP